METVYTGIFNDCFPPILDGVALTVKNYADCLSRKGVPVCVVTPGAPHREGEYPYLLLDYQSLPVPMRPPYRFGMPYLDMAFLRRFRSVRFDLIHAHSPFMTGDLALRTARQQHIPLVATFHSKFRQDFERALRFGPLVDFAVQQVVHFFEQADEVWIPQASVEPTLREYGYQGRVTVMDNGNDFVCPPEEVAQVRADMRAELGIGPKEPMYLFVGQHIWEKNIGLVIDALSQMKDRPWKLYTIGIGYAEDAIREKIDALGLDDRVTMVGCVYDRARLRRYYAAADLFLFPSLYDNAPLVVREAAALHTPAVMLQGSTAADVIRDGFNGFLTENSAEAYAEALRMLAEQPELVAEVSKNAAKTLARSWDDVLDEVIQRYADIRARYKKEHP